MIGVLVAVVCVGLVWRWRRQRRSTLAGLNAVKPQYMVEPPHKRHGSRRTELL